MEQEKVQPIRRPWLEEAYKIAHGDQNIVIKKEHVKAAIDTLISFSQDAEKLRRVMHIAYQEACKKREENGLPAPPHPPSLSKGFLLPWDIQKLKKKT